jgi:hypothetical protein
LGEPPGDRRDVGARPLDRDAGLQPRDDLEKLVPPARRPVRGVDRERHPEFRGFRKAHGRRGDADDDVRVSVQADHATDDGRVGREAARPQPVAQHHDAVRPI